MIKKFHRRFRQNLAKSHLHPSQVELIKPDYVTNCLRIRVNSIYGSYSQTVSIEDAAELCHRSPATVRRWLRQGKISDDACALWLAVIVVGIVPFESWEGFIMDEDHQMIDQHGRKTTSMMVQDYGRLWGECQRLQALLKQLEIELQNQPLPGEAPMPLGYLKAVK